MYVCHHRANRESRQCCRHFPASSLRNSLDQNWEFTVSEQGNLRPEQGISAAALGQAAGGAM
jgi:hypothetical protein